MPTELQILHFCCLYTFQERSCRANHLSWHVLFQYHVHHWNPTVWISSACIRATLYSVGKTWPQELWPPWNVKCPTNLPLSQDIAKSPACRMESGISHYSHALQVWIDSKWFTILQNIKIRNQILINHLRRNLT